MISSKEQQRGAVSLFVVIFSALLLTVVTVSFMRVMMQEQRQSTDNDLSQSAYDSAQAGVEDAKRVVVACNQGNATACTAIRQNNCNTVSAAGITTESGGANSETVLQTNTAGGRELNQAYTCVKIDTTSPDYLAELQEGQTLMIPLRAAGAVERIEIKWFKQEKDNVTPANASAALNTISTMAGTLPKKASWPANGPALLNAQVIAPNASFSVADLDASEVTQTVFLYPSRVGTNGIDLTGVRRDTPSEPRLTRCNPAQYQNGGYLCTMTLDLVRTIPPASRVSYLRINGIYQGSSLQVVLRDAGGQVVRFDGVQFTVDSTGRANDVFRRVESRLSVAGGDFPYPAGAVELSGSLCKDFFVSSDSAGGATCTP